MALPIVEGKSTIKSLSTQFIEIEYERNILSRSYYWLVKFGEKSGIILFILSVLANRFPILWLLIALIVIMLFSVNAVFSRLNHNVKSVSIRPDLLVVKYFGLLNLDIKKELNTFDYLDFEINIYEDGSTVSIQNVEIPLHDMTEFPKLVDGIAAMFNLEYTDTARLSDGTEILTYKSKTKNKVIYPSSLKIELESETVTITDWYNSSSFVRVDKLINQFSYSNSGSLKTADDLNKVEEIMIRHCFREEIAQSYLEILFVISGQSKQVFRTAQKSIKHELTTIRDVKLIYDIFNKLALPNVATETIKLSN